MSGISSLTFINEISEDEYFKKHDEVQKTTDEYVAKCDKILSEKEKDIIEF